ncbi:MAG: GNAT family N-acetyltransferase [Solirubrobacteraceae bacterium]
MPHNERAAESLARALEFMRAVLVSTADETRPISAGLVVRTPSLPAVWSANQLRVTQPLGFDALLQLADEQLPQLGYVDIAAEDQVAGQALEPAFRAAGWKVQRDVIMVLSEPPDRLADTSIVADAREDELMDLMDRWYAEDPGPSARERVELVEYNRREVRVHGDRTLGVRSSDGRLVAITKLRSDGSTAQVEDVYTVPEARGRGYARALVSRAAELAREDGAGLTFIVADDNDWPRLLYGRIGFRPVGHVWHFHRP